MIKRLFLIAILPICLCSCASLNVASFDSSKSVLLENDETNLWERSKEEQERLSSGNFLYDDENLNQYVNNVLVKIIPEEARDSKLSFKAEIIKDPRLNALCYPNGMIYIHTGMLARMDNEAQLATVLGHEMAHSVKRHMLKQFRGLKNKTAFMTTLHVTLVGVGGIYGEVASVLGQLGTIGAFYGYSREHEREADSYGFERTLKAGYDISESPKVFEHLKDNFDKEKRPDPFFFSSHPKLNERIKSYKRLIEAMPQYNGGIKNDTEFLNITEKLLLDNAEMDISIGRFETARVTIEKYLNNFPDKPCGYYYMGKIYEEKFEQPENKRLKEKIAKEEIKKKAIEYYEKALSFDSRYAPACRNLGMLYFKDGNKKEAKKHFANYLAFASNNKDMAYIENYLKECGNE